jgi:hypothetical protein
LVHGVSLGCRQLHIMTIEKCKSEFRMNKQNIEFACFTTYCISC